jgi:hypothetical protein
MCRLTVASNDCFPWETTSLLSPMGNNFRSPSCCACATTSVRAGRFRCARRCDHGRAPSASFSYARCLGHGQRVGHSNLPISALYLLANPSTPETVRREILTGPPGKKVIDRSPHPRRRRARHRHRACKVDSAATQWQASRTPLIRAVLVRTIGEPYPHIRRLWLGATPTGQPQVFVDRHRRPQFTDGGGGGASPRSIILVISV